MNTSIVEINVLGIILFLLLMIDGKRSMQIQKNNKFFYRVIFFTVLALTANTLLYYSVSLQKTFFFQYFMVIVYLISVEMGAYYWLSFIFHELLPEEQCNPSAHLLYILPIFFVSIMVLCSPYTHWIFYINEKKQYIQGNLYFLQNLVVYGYILTGAATSLVLYKKEYLIEKQKICFYLFLYSLFPLLGKGIDTLFPMLHITTAAVIISIVMLYLCSLKKEIHLDPLTQLNNRRKFEQHLIQITKASKNKIIFLIFFDINNFKIINDSFGHVEGDKALIIVAQVLKKVFSDTKAFLSRYGGDEFAVIMANEDGDALPYIEKIDASLVEISASLPYTLSLSVGYSVYGEDNATTIESLVQAADKKMYCDKQQKKQNLC
ncbi:putative diguanylate cyclase YfiN [Anaerotignum neopropionicum]|uniref:Putative diguanylate cyclase YfiN n=1 Tax=Anaerotignum neopropionicum TaxID=36847 RepID=A0A136WD20_9FIRM|nr:GGDEF domain-containing protein [Anaerotignum neopropionicum]KXL52376.1 putative diguanylate cyclase YfiN [Anaerotignum neopropionicum]